MCYIFMIPVITVLITLSLVKAGFANVITVPVDIYISEKGKEQYSTRMEDLESAMDKVRQKLEANLNQRAGNEATNKYSALQFYINVLTETPRGIDLDECGQNVDILFTQLQNLHNMNTRHNVIAFYTCPSSTYFDYFSNANMETPLLIQRDNLTCVQRMASFVEPERPKFELTFANALMAAAGCPINNPVSLKEDDGGDRGVQINYFVDHDAYDLLFRNGCDRIPN